MMSGSAEMCVNRVQFVEVKFSAYRYQPKNFTVLLELKGHQT